MIFKQFHEEMGKLKLRSRSSTATTSSDEPLPAKPISKRGISVGADALSGRLGSMARLLKRPPRTQSESPERRKRSSERRRSTMHRTSTHRRSTLVSRSRSQRMASYMRRARRRIREEPVWLQLLKNAYHTYGLKHLVLVVVFLLYALFGATILALIEMPAQAVVKESWHHNLAVNRSAFVSRMMSGLFNNSQYLVFLPRRTSLLIRHHMHSAMREYETTLNIKYTEQKIEWDFWNAILYAGTIATTIGYGHIYPRTSAGRIITMIYSIGGIPLVLLVLQDLGRLLTVGLKFPWFQFKRGFRRCLRYLTKQSWEEMMEIEDRERRDLEVFDLPIPVAIALVIGWIFVCSATFCVWERQWTYLEAFYFFFISLSTVGLGDLTPENPRLLLMMFGYIIVGLSLVSMVINLIQMKMARTYQVGNLEAVALDILSVGETETEEGEIIANGGSLGLSATSFPDAQYGALRTPAQRIRARGLFLSNPSLTDSLLMGSNYRGLVLAGTLTPRRLNKATQTTLCFPATRELIQCEDGSMIKRSESTDDITQLLLRSEAEARVLHDVGETYEEEGKEVLGGYGSPDSLPLPRT